LATIPGAGRAGPVATPEGGGHLRPAGGLAGRPDYLLRSRWLHPSVIMGPARREQPAIGKSWPAERGDPSAARGLRVSCLRPSMRVHGRSYRHRGVSVGSGLGVGLTGRALVASSTAMPKRSVDSPPTARDHGHRSGFDPRGDLDRAVRRRDGAAACTSGDNSNILTARIAPRDLRIPRGPASTTPDGDAA